MKICERNNLPQDHSYYRTTSPLYKKYLEKCGLKIHELKLNRFGWIKNIFGFFQIAKFERVDEEPNIEELKKNGFKHGLIIWIPYSITKKPNGWRKFWINSHLTTTGFTLIENEFYYKKWKDRAKRARKKFLENKELNIKFVDTEAFQNIYKNVKISQPFKSAFVKYHMSISKFDIDNNIKNMVCYYNGKAIAGLSVINYNGNSSAHLVSFLTKEGKPLQAGTGLIDLWFKNSFENNLKYINFDHLRDKNMSRDQQGYTDFKENFIENKVFFNDSYFKII